MERKPKTCVKAGQLADEYELARQQEPRAEGTEFKKQLRTRGNVTLVGRWVISRETAESRKVLQVLMVLSCVYTVRSMDSLHEIALTRMHFIAEIKKKSELYQSGVVESKKVNKILLDTGCSTTMIHKSWVRPHKLKEGDVVTIRCAHGDYTLLQMLIWK